MREIEEKAKCELGVISQKRDSELDDLHAQRKRTLEDLDFLTANKLTFLRTNTMTMEQIKTDELRLKIKIEEIDAKISVYTESAFEMLKYVITFSELVKSGSLYYEFALDSEKREITAQVFSELVFCGKKLVKYTAKEGFDALLDRSWITGSPSYLFTELFRIYPSVKLSMERMGKSGVFGNVLG